MKIKKIARRVFPNIYIKLYEIKKTLLVRRFKLKYPETKIFEKPESILYSQENQDYIIYNNFFYGKSNGVFCDVGGNHPLNINNTRYFEELGWSGYAFEPLQNMKVLWQEHRRAKLFPFAVSDCEGEVTFTLVKDETGWEDMLSFVKETRVVDYDFEMEDIKVQTRILKNVFDEENITHIDYMSIDIEGHELNAIKGIDFSKVRINVLTIENNSGESVANGDHRITEIMFKNDYILWGRIIELDDIYVHKEFLESLQ